MTPVSVALIDDQPVFVEGFIALCQRMNIRLVGTAAAASGAAALITHYRPNIVFVDVASPDNPPEAILRLSTISPQVKIVALTAARSIALAIQTLDAGAYGYVLKQSSTDDLCLAIQALCRGEKFITHGFASKIVSALQDSTIRKNAAEALKLTIRENQIVHLLVRGKTNKEIATILSISEKTVKHYMTVLMQKLNVRNRLEVAIAAQTLGHGQSVVEHIH